MFRSKEGINFGTKAETLERLLPLLKKARILPIYYFNFSSWLLRKNDLLKNIQEYFGSDNAYNKYLVVRSSAYNEDGRLSSLAGVYKSLLNIEKNDVDKLKSAIDEVFDSYEGNPLDQVLIQPMLEDVTTSGVIMTYDISTGAPYYIINYDDESGKTDSITGGKGVNKTLVVHHLAKMDFVYSKRIASILEMLFELELLCGANNPLDIEFAQTSDDIMYVLQVRRITLQKNWNRNIRSKVNEAMPALEDFVVERSHIKPWLAGSKTILANMPDWNPAEIIGTNPRPLAFSLYHELITKDVWRAARASMGYRNVPYESLMVSLAGKPFIDVRNSFNSFLPDGLDDTSSNILVSAWIDRLNAHPEFHDKVEFKVAFTAYDFTFDSKYKDWYGDILSKDSFNFYRELLFKLTSNNVSTSKSASLKKAISLIKFFESDLSKNNIYNNHNISHINQLDYVNALVHNCKKFGTYPFAIIARHAFIAESLLRSATERGAISEDSLLGFKRSLKTITSQLTTDFKKVLTKNLSKEDFFLRYGHLRPGTYDILSLRYDQRRDLFDGLDAPSHSTSLYNFKISERESNDLGKLLLDSGFDKLSTKEFLEYSKLAIEQREYSKFVFTKALSDILELIASWGETRGLMRDDLSFLKISELLNFSHEPLLKDIEAYLKNISEERSRECSTNHAIRLGYLIRDTSDLFVIPIHRSTANFVSKGHLERRVIFVDSRMDIIENLYDKIVLIENADPGFDWIFTKGIAGLITKFGGANSHMTIRCAELNIPAAIGVGEQLFDRVFKSSKVELNCIDKYVRTHFE